MEESDVTLPSTRQGYERVPLCPADKKLFPFQFEGVWFLFQRNRALLASDPGTGKTVQLICAANVLAESSDGLKILVLCPKSVRLNWEKEIRIWGLYDLTTRWTVTNWDKLLRKEGEILASQDWDIVIADESHTCIKNPKAKRCKFFIERIVPRAERVWLATATPASKSALDYYCTLQVLLPEEMKKWKVSTFEKEFCEVKYSPFTYNKRQYYGFKNKQILRKIFSAVCLRHRKDEVLPQLPPKIYTDIPVEVDKSIVAEHLQLNESYVAGMIAAGEPLPGHVAHVMQATAMAKLDSALEIIGNFPEDESLVVFAWHHSVVEALHTKIPGSVVITGQTSEKVRQHIVDQFQAGTAKRLVCNMAAGGVGITLTAARTCMYIEFPFSPIHLVQSENRVHRIGSSGSHIQIIRLIGVGTVDQAIFRVLDERVAHIDEVGV